MDRARRALVSPPFRRLLVAVALVASAAAACGQYADATGPQGDPTVGTQIAEGKGTKAQKPRKSPRPNPSASGRAGAQPTVPDGPVPTPTTPDVQPSTPPVPTTPPPGGGLPAGSPPCPGEVRPGSASPPVAGATVLTPHAVQLREVTFTSLDGRETGGLLGIPSGNGPFPGVVHVHGGFGKAPEADMVKKIASAGFVVLDPDYRFHDVGGAEVDDAVAAGRYLRQHPMVRPGGIGIMGGSHGGSITALAVGRFPGEFAAAVAVASATDWACIWEKYQGDAIAAEIERSMGGTPQQVPDEYRRRSPYAWTQGVRTPTLVMHSIHDGQVPPGQSQNLVDLLRAAGAPVTWRPTDASGHGFLQKQPTSGPDWQEALRFLKTYLG